MLPLLILVATILLTASFIGLTAYEGRHAVRLFDERRAALDHVVRRVQFIIEHVDFAAFLEEAVRHLAHRIAHDSVHLSLQLVRAVERLLTRVVRSFRSREGGGVPRESTRAFVKTLSDFKEQLKAVTPEVSEIQ